MVVCVCFQFLNIKELVFLVLCVGVRLEFIQGEGSIINFLFGYLAIDLCVINNNMKYSRNTRNVRLRVCYECYHLQPRPNER